MAARLPRARLMMIGSGELADDIQARINALGLRDRAHLDSAIPGAIAIDAFDAVVMPSRYEAMSYVMLEAAAGGKPLVLTKVGGAGMVLEHGKNGLLVANSDEPEALAAAMATLAEPGKLQQFSAEARRRRDNYTIAGMADATEEIYFELLGYPSPTHLRMASTALQLQA
jgi:glycosyltransferase involved in cell wall biosynthesis